MVKYAAFTWIEVFLALVLIGGVGAIIYHYRDSFRTTEVLSPSPTPSATAILKVFPVPSSTSSIIDLTPAASQVTSPLPSSGPADEIGLILLMSGGFGSAGYYAILKQRVQKKSRAIIVDTQDL